MDQNQFNEKLLRLLLLDVHSRTPNIYIHIYVFRVVEDFKKQAQITPRFET